MSPTSSTVSRRAALLGALGATAAVAASGLAVRLANATAPMLGATKPSVYR